MKSSSVPKTKYKSHTFISADGTKYVWEERKETKIPLEANEIEEIRKAIMGMPDEVIQNDESGNGIPMGVNIPLSEDRLEIFLALILNVIKLKELHIGITEHAEQRLEEDMINGDQNPYFRGWLSEDDVRHCVLTINQVDGARLTINRSTLKDPEIKFNSTLALEVCGTRPDGKQGTLALAIIEPSKIRIITLL